MEDSSRFILLCLTKRHFIVQCEIAGDHARGRMICIEYICLNMGYLLSIGVGWGLFRYINVGTISWKAMFILQGGLASILIFASFFIPETPRVRHAHCILGVPVAHL